MNKISIVIPIYNEVENIENLYNEIIVALNNKIEFEIILVNDYSNDGSDLLLNKLNENDFTNILSNNKNMGQSYSLYNGITKAKNNVIVTLDGDGQNDPNDILTLIKIYFDSEDISLVGGIRIKRKDNIIKIVSSKIANSFRSFILNDNCSDTGCGLKVFNKNIFLKIPYFDGMHRFLPALFNGYGYKTTFYPVNHRPRVYGISKYGTLDRLFKGIKDIIKVKKIINERKK